MQDVRNLLWLMDQKILKEKYLLTTHASVTLAAVTGNEDMPRPTVEPARYQRLLAQIQVLDSLTDK
jgi:hypothetical protein